MQNNLGNFGHSAALGAGILFFALIALVILLIPAIFYILTLQKALNKCAPENRAMQPGMVWLLLVPLVNMVWGFFVVINMAKSLGAEFQKRGIAEEAEPGKKLGLIMCVLLCCGIIPLLGMLCSLGGLVCWIMYWLKIAGFSKKLD
jgi:magnesium-transporting ATPase (P-type)